MAWRVQGNVPKSVTMQSSFLTLVPIASAENRGTMALLTAGTDRLFIKYCSRCSFCEIQLSTGY